MFYFTLDHLQIAQQVAELINNYNKLSTKRSASDIRDGKINYVVETHGNWVLGAVGLDRQSYTFTEVKHLVVRPKWKNKGLAHHLLKRAFGLVDTRMVYATVRENNKTSLKLLKGLGFEDAGNYATENYRVVLLVRVTPQWKQTKSVSKPHWLAEQGKTPVIGLSTPISLEPGQKMKLGG